MTKKTISILLALAFSLFYLLNISPFSSAEGISVNIECNKKIVAYWKAVDQGNWKQWIETFAPSANHDAKSLVSIKENHANNIGILTVASAEIVSIESIDDFNVFATAYREFETFFRSPETYSCYNVKVRLAVIEENDYFKDGTNTFIMTLIKESGTWGVASLSASNHICLESVPANDVCNGLTKDTPAPGSLIGFASLPSCKAVPDTINVKDNSGVVRSRVPFDSFLLNVVCNEMRDQFPAQAEYAQIMVIKTMAWWFCMKKPFAAYGYDIPFGWVAYTSALPSDATPQMINTINGYINTMKPYCMVTSSATGGKLFFSDYDGYAIPSNGGKGSGTLNQHQAKRLALGLVDGKQYNWREILHYFYDNAKIGGNSSYSVGIVQFITPGSHSFGAGYSSSAQYHWKTCSKCSCIKANSYSAHSWITSNGVVLCSYCRKKRLDLPRNVSHESICMADCSQRTFSIQLSSLFTTVCVIQAKPRLTLSSRVDIVE